MKANLCYHNGHGAANSWCGKRLLFLTSLGGEVLPRHYNQIVVPRGLEFANALHLCSRPPGAPFVSFDQSFVRAAQRAGVSDISGVSARNPR
jgi:hypothetical protein